jgi:hypothetical protein
MINTIIYAGVAQQVEQLTCNQQVGGSNPSTSSKKMTPLSAELFLYLYLFSDKIKT